MSYSRSRYASPYNVPTVDAFSPSQISGLVFQNIARPSSCFVSGTTPCADTDPMATWLDSSPNAIPYTQADATRRPTLRLVGGKWFARFDGTNDHLSAGNIGAFFPTAGTIFAALNILSGVVYEFMSTRANDSYARFSDGNSYPGQLRTTRLSGMPGINNGNRIIVIRSSATAWTRRVNGVQDVNQAANFNSGDLWQIGCARSGGVDVRFINADIATFGAYSNILSDADVLTLETYLQGLL
jgi:hypothetical protein